MLTLSFIRYQIHRIDFLPGIVYPAIDGVVQPSMRVELVNIITSESIINYLTLIFKMLLSVYIRRYSDGHWMDINMESFMPRE